MDFWTIAILGGLSVLAILVGAGISAGRLRSANINANDFVNSPAKWFKAVLDPYDSTKTPSTAGHFKAAVYEDEPRAGGTPEIDFKPPAGREKVGAAETGPVVQKFPGGVRIGAGSAKGLKTDPEGGLIRGIGSKDREKGKESASPAFDANEEDFPSSAPKSPKIHLSRNPGEMNIAKATLYENVPEEMIVGVPAPIEVSIAKEGDTDIHAAIKKEFVNPKTHDVFAGAVMGVKLIDQSGAFDIQPFSPETQWIDREKCLALGDINFAKWRWVATPKRRGKVHLAIVVSMRTVGQGGLIGDMAFPDQIIPVKVRINYPQTAGKVLKWTGTLIIGAVAGQLIQELFN